VIATVCLLLLVGYLLPIESIGFSKTFAKIPKIKLPFSFSNEDEGAVQRAEGYQQPQISLREEIAFYVDHANSARAGNQLMDSLYYESEALKLSHEKKVILDRINSDLNSLYQNGSVTYGKDGLAFLYELAAHNPRANDIIVRHFQNVGN